MRKDWEKRVIEFILGIKFTHRSNKVRNEGRNEIWKKDKKNKERIDKDFTDKERSKKR